ncbi:3D domain-containing protein [Sporolactobacillus laevolacticus]|jgi:3D (Asp-Asp-Asp) domain-containing protein|uniref:Peptidoglycan-binding protein LysM n=1 Tax=Sporolactobacillus laevolacticus DSM 442 TaxID=1395513 RepID=V6J2T2_9BACL|nr:3D domain-containing protein [Sporolactobacillus laevolacticus]EST13486.1 peptidoglycan-binding protein LysM [Sporolactobacillus laevolacticus DSM 442]
MKKIILLLAVITVLFSGLPENSATAKSKYKNITVSATSYCELGRTATGFDYRTNPKAKAIAVDPRVIPLGSKVYVPGYGTAIARDVGGRIKGKIIDVHFKTRKQAITWGRKKIKIKVYSY